MAGEKWEENLPCPACNMCGCPYCDDTGRVSHIKYSGYGKEERLELLLTEFIAKCGPLAYQNELGACSFCGGPRIFLNKIQWIPDHSEDCLLTRVEEALHGYIDA